MYFLYACIYLVHLKVVPWNSIGKCMRTKGTKHFPKDYKFSYLQLSTVCFITNVKINYLKSNQLNCSDLNLHEKLKLSKNHQLSKSQQDSHTRENNEHVICHCKKVIVNVSILSSLTIFTTDSAWAHGTIWNLWIALKL